MKNKLFLLDAYTLIFRAYYAFIKNPRINSKGLNTSAILGFTNSLDEVIRKEQPSHIAVVFDPPTENFRNKLYPDYKAQRSETPEDIKTSIPYIKKVIEGFNIPVIEIEGYEADDTVGTLAHQAAKEGFEVYMMTTDKDYYQLLEDNVFIYKPKRSGSDTEIISKKAFLEKSGLDDPKQFIDILAIWGDTADNIKGIPGVGEKTAFKLIKQFGSLENIYKNVNKLKGKLKENVYNSREITNLSYKLVKIDTEVPVEFNAEKYKLESFNKKELERIFEELEFKALAKRIFNNADLEQDEDENKTIFKQISDFDTKYELIDTDTKREKLILALQKQEEFCFDTETTSLDTHAAELLGIAFSFKNNQAYYLPIPEDETKSKQVLNEIHPVFSDKNILKIGQNIKYDILILKNHGIDVNGELFDTMVAHYLIRPEQSHNMEFLAEKYLNYKPIPIENLIGEKGKNQLTMKSVPIEKIVDYACEDADITFQLKQILDKELEQQNLINLAKTIEMPLIYVLAEMEYEGIKLDSKYLNNYSKNLKERIISKEKEIYKDAGIEFNVSSPKQLGDVLFNQMKIIENPKLTKTKQYSTSEEELLKLQDKHPIINKILDYRSLKKLNNTYAEALPKLIKSETGRIHTSFNQTIVSTGRLSSNNPNLQNIPIRTTEGKEIRKAFIAKDENHVLLAADYSQIELRLMAHLSNDEAMIEAFKNNEDIHSATASKIFNVELKDVTKEMRYHAKSANFGIIYGISSFGLAQNLSISRTDAKNLIDNYFKSYPKVKIYMDNAIDKARKQGFVTTIMNRKRYLPDINSRNFNVRGNAERNAINAPVQGSAADIIKSAMIKIHHKFNSKHLKSRILLQVHDELILDVEKSELKQIKEIVQSEMENILQLKIKLNVEIGTGKNWLEAH